MAWAIRCALSPLPMRDGLGVSAARNIGVLAQGGAFALYAAWLAVLWEGCAVVPLSAEISAERIRSIVEDALVSVVLVTDQGSAEAAEATFHDSNASCRDVRVVDVQTLETTAAGNGDSHEEDRLAAVEEAVDNSDSAGGNRDCYIYYTSGSSGEPKGVSSGHGPMINRLRWMWQRWPFAEDEVCCQRVDHVFIDFVAEMFGPLSCGIPIILVPDVVRKNPIILRDFISEYGVTRITLVPTFAKLIVEASTASSDSPPTPTGRPSPRKTAAAIAFFKSVRLWILSGEALPWSVAYRLAQLSQPTSTLLNLYGSTEVAADITFSSWKCGTVLSSDGGSDKRGGHADVNRGNTSSVPIGRPISGCGAELMEEAEVLEQGSESETRDYHQPTILRVINPRDHGRVGMLYVYGAGLARGYLRRKSATEECFPSYTWDSAASCYRLCSSDAPVTTTTGAPRAPEDQGVHNAVVGGSGENGCRDGRPVRFFRTGDLASFEKGHDGGDGHPNEEGVLVYRGREDQQVKISGKRLDLGEVEACLFRADGVKLGAAVALSGHHDFIEKESSGEEGLDLVFAVVSPETTDANIVREHMASSFAVPLVVLAVPIVPTLPSSGKVDRGEVRRMALEHLRHQRGNVDCAVSAKVTGSRREESGGWNRTVEEVVNIIKKALVCALQPSRDALEGHTEISDKSDFFAEAGLSSVQAVNLVHELRRMLSASEGNNRCDGPHTVRLIDLYLHPSCHSLAQWLVSTVDRTAGEVTQANRDFSREASLQAVASTVSSEGNSLAPEALDRRSSGDVNSNIQPITRDLRPEMVALFCNVFLDSEPLLSTSFNRCRASVGPAGAAVMRLCYNRLVSRSIDSLSRSGGRVLVATEHATGRVLGFTIGTELVESAEGSGFYAGRVEVRESLEEASGPARRDMPSMNANRRTQPTPWQKATSWLLGLPIAPMMRSVSALIDELLSIYQYDRGWAYAPGEVMYISETGCRLDQETAGAGGGSGVQAALMAESLERQLVLEASAAGFIRAVTICTNAVTVHVARELGFKEVERIHVQTYRPLRGQRKPGRWRGRSWIPRQDGTPTSVGEHPSNRDPGSEPFARVPAGHAYAVLFEKVLAPCVTPGLLLHQNHQEKETRTTCSAALSGSGVAFAAGGLWRLVRVGQGSPEHQREMFAILANSLPALSFSGCATRYMADDTEQGQEAFLLLSARVTAAGTRASEETPTTAPPVADEPNEDHSNDVVPSLSRWTVAACMSWRHHASGSDDSLEAAKPDMEAVDKAAAGEARRPDEGVMVLPYAWRELLVLAVGRRWRYRGLGAALVARLLRDSAHDGESHVYVRSLPESVGFYERQGFRPAQGVEDTGREQGGASPVPSRDAECLLVHDLAQGTFVKGSSPGKSGRK